MHLFNLLLYWISRLVPKDENIWIFGAWFGTKYSDNSRFLYEYIINNHREIRAIWITQDDDIIKELDEKGYEVYRVYSLKSILLGLRAKCSIFVQSNSSDCMFFLNNKNTKLIQLWHGIPLKKIGFDNNLIDHNDIKIKKRTSIFPFLEEEYDLIISSSIEDQGKFITAFRNSNVYITGYPRNDKLLDKKMSKIFTITYLPTFRDSIGDKIDLFSRYNFDLEKWNNYLFENRIILNIKLHPVNKLKDEVLLRFKECKNIHFLDEVDVAEVLPITNILITDYSSVYFDYLLTDNPIIFTPFDYEKYITKDRELYYNYNEVTPGPKCKDWGEVLDWISKFRENPELFKDRREKIKNRFHQFDDGNNCKRVYEKIIKTRIKNAK